MWVLICGYSSSPVDRVQCGRVWQQCILRFLLSVAGAHIPCVVSLSVYINKICIQKQGLGLPNYIYFRAFYCYGLISPLFFSVELVTKVPVGIGYEWIQSRLSCTGVAAHQWSLRQQDQGVRHSL